MSSAQVVMPTRQGRASCMRSMMFSIGHSTRSIEEFRGLLVEHEVDAIADVRRVPASRRFPHFRSEDLAAALAIAGIRYTHIPELGGRRRPHPDSVNTAWHNSAFQGYADYLATPEFARGLAALLDVAAGARVALVCAEAVWWRCHRRLVADVLVVRGFPVEHILGPGSTVSHALPTFARVDGVS